MKRNFTALKTLLGETPAPEETVTQKLASKIESKRKPTAQSRDAEEKYALIRVLLSDAYLKEKT